MDLVGTCPKSFWEEWLTEGDCAGDPPGETLYCWRTRARMVVLIKPGDRFYVVAHGRLRGFAVVHSVESHSTDTGVWFESWIYRPGGAVAVTIPENIVGFRGLRQRWWSRGIERPFPEWKTP